MDATQLIQKDNGSPNATCAGLRERGGKKEKRERRSEFPIADFLLFLLKNSMPSPSRRSHGAALAFLFLIVIALSSSCIGAAVAAAAADVPPEDKAAETGEEMEGMVL
jgi:hypothetical protein